MPHPCRNLVLVLAFAAGLAFPAAALAEVLFYEAILDGTQEIPPTGSPAMGYGAFTIDTDANTIRYHITFEPDSLMGFEIAAHIHCCAPPGETGPIMIFLPPGSPKVGEGTYFEWNEASLLAGLTYANIHTGICPTGEIRGQIVPAPTPAGDTSWGRIKSRFR